MLSLHSIYRHFLCHCGYNSLYFWTFLQDFISLYSIASAVSLAPSRVLSELSEPENKLQK